MGPVGLALEMTQGRWGAPDHLCFLNERLMEASCSSGRRLIVTMPPRHGKSETASHWFPTWLLGCFPERRVILCSYEADFAASWGRKVRDSLSEACDLGIFSTRVRADSKAANRWQVEGHEGGMVTAGVGGAITGRGADLLIVDDPVKNDEQAMSGTYRDKAWEWWNATAVTRLEPGGSVVLIQTRWHHEDLAGRILSDKFNDPDDIAKWEVVNFPAIAEEHDVLGRKPGEALWPERYDVEAIEAARRRDPFWFAALYQQRPVPRSGGMFKGEWFVYADTLPRVVRQVRYWDLAGTEGGGDWTAGLLLSECSDGNFYVTDVRHAQLSPHGVELLVVATAHEDGPQVPVYIEQDPGQAGKGQVANYQRLPGLMGYAVRGNLPTGPKDVRAIPVASKLEAGIVRLLRAPWNREFTSELIAYNPADKAPQDDQIDTLSGAWTVLTAPQQQTRRIKIADRVTLGGR